MPRDHTASDAADLWSALDLAMTPLEGEEMAEAAEFAASVDS